MPFSSAGDVAVVCGLAGLLVVCWDRISTDGSTALSIGVYVLAAVVAVRVARKLEDGLNSLTIILGLCLLRIGLPTVLLLVSDVPANTVLSEFNIVESDLLEAQEFAAGGVLAIIVGWYACPPSWARAATRLHRLAGRLLTADARIVPAATWAFAAGIANVLVYLVLSFGNPFAAVLSGVARGNSAPGTSRYGFTAIALLITSAVLLTLYLARQPQRSRLVVYAPSLLAGAVLTIFGGRVGALTPIGLALLGVAYLRRSDGGARRRATPRARSLVAAVVVGFLLLGYVSFVAAYRGDARLAGGESGIAAASSTLRGDVLISYAQNSLWTEVSTLHPYALADWLGPGALEGRTYPETLGLVSQLAGIRGERPGQTMVERFGVSGYLTVWGFHTGLIVDVFVNSGLVWALVAGILFGAVLRAEYVGFRRADTSIGSTFLHCVSVWTMLWVFFESLVVLLSQFQLILPAVTLIVLGARLVPGSAPARGGVRPRFGA
ncbi:MAG: hypothetical protein H0U86_11885 [Chloroflexi bacterium]|nr:hypothetical protein [Chloroflexota bacterium]